MICDNRYCANSPQGLGNYEHVAGILCDRCEDFAEAHADDDAICANCDEKKQYHADKDYACPGFEIEDVDRTCCETMSGEPHTCGKINAARS